MIQVLGTTLGPIHLVVLGAMAIAITTDLSRGKIANALTLPLWGIGVVGHVVMGFTGHSQWWVGLLGLVILFPLHFLLFATGVDRGGDAKLMIGVGACLGWWLGLEATIWHLILMAPVGLIVAAFLGKLEGVWAATVYTLKRPIYQALQWPLTDPPEATYIPKAPVLAVSTILAIFTPWFEWVVPEAWRGWLG